MNPNEKTEQKSEKTPEKRERKLSPMMIAFKETFDAEANLEKRLQITLDFMKESLSQGGSPRFRDFWDAKHLALALFKESLNPVARSHLWSQYTELISEAQRLKEILDEQASFAIEQIELAIDAIIKDLSAYEEGIKQSPDLIFPDKCSSVEGKEASYAIKQKEIHFLNKLATRLNSLRKEVIQTEMRIRHKNKILSDISALGDQILPKRKELIKSISDAFLSDVGMFVNEHFTLESKTLKESEKPSPVYALRSEIKALQAVAKLISLNSFSFKESRTLLSDCWEILREQEKENKKEDSEKKEIFEENAKKISELLDGFEKKVTEETLASPQINTEMDAIISEMKNVELGRVEVKSLKDRLFSIKKIALSKIQEQKQQIIELEMQKEKEIKDQIAKLFERLSTALDASDETSLEDLLEMKETLSEERSPLSLSSSDEDGLAQLFQQLDFEIISKREKEITQIADEEEKFAQLDELIEELEELREKVKEKQESFRKLVGKSGLDFEAAMTYREYLDTQRTLLSSIDHDIKRLEEFFA